MSVFGLSALVAALLLFAWPSTADRSPGVFTINANLVPGPGDDPLQREGGRFFLVHLAAGEGTHGGFGAPGLSGLIALSALDPHSVARARLSSDSVYASSACDIPWRSDFHFEGSTGWFRDPCGGSTYTKAGVRVFGPSPHGMTTFAVDVRGDGSVVVDTNRATSGRNDNPLRAVPYSRP